MSFKTGMPSGLEQRAKKEYERLKSIERQYRGQYIAIDPISLDYFIGNSLAQAILKARVKHPDRLFWTTRIGYTSAVVV